jgi:hypothetical protein
VKRHEKIESYGGAHAALVAALPEFPREMWQWRGSPEQWTIHHPQQKRLDDDG